jgi:hypothetical protein
MSSYTSFNNLPGNYGSLNNSSSSNPDLISDEKCKDSEKLPDSIESNFKQIPLEPCPGGSKKMHKISHVKTQAESSSHKNGDIIECCCSIFCCFLGGLQ